MKLFQVLALNVATVVIALVVYDQMRSDDPRGSSDRAASSRTEVGNSIGLEDRLREIETKLAAIPEGRNRSWDAAPTNELAEAPTAGAQKDLPAPNREPEAANPRSNAQPTPGASADEPSKAELARFRKLQDAVRRENTVKKNWERINRQLDKAGVNLTPAQREQVHYAWAEFEPRITRIWGAIKTEARTTADAGGAVDGKALREQGSAQIQSEFAASLADIVNHQADAAAVAAALTARGGK